MCPTVYIVLKFDLSVGLLRNDITRSNIKIDNSPGFDVVNGALLVYRVSKPLENVDVEERLLVIIWGRERKIVKTHVYVVVADSNVGIVERKHDGCFVEIGLKRYVN